MNFEKGKKSVISVHSTWILSHLNSIREEKKKPEHDSEESDSATFLWKKIAERRWDSVFKGVLTSSVLKGKKE